MPIATFGLELWIHNDKSIKALENFQTFVGRRIQRLFSISPNTCAYFALGWVRIEPFIEIKKMLFVHSIMARDNENVIKSIFIQRAKHYYNDELEHSENVHGSIMYDLLNNVNVFGLCDLKNMVYRVHIWNRAHWREKVWKRAWELEDVLWCLKSTCQKSLELLTNVCDSFRYIIWWQLADKYHWMMRDCEIMIKILCHSGLLRTDDVTPKSLPISAGFCPLCNLGAAHDAIHLIMQCPSSKI